MAAITLDIGANTRQAEKDIQKLVSRSYNINLNTKGDQPLGRITGKVNEFSKSLDASNARVIAFGASAGIIFGLERAFTALVSSTIEVQKSLQDINVILNVSAQNLQKFGAELFGIARNTGQSFQEVAKAATEFSRQGLGVEETLKRTNEALILSRLSGLDTAKSVEALTAAVNSFASQAVTATEIVNKFANVDAAFAVSSADLADAIARVGSSAAQSGVSLNELIAIVTSAQQTTARGGAVIGNSFKTIFTRLQREKVVDLLGSLGISGTDSSGQVKSTIQLLTDLGKVYDTLGSQQQAYVAEQVGGVFQINILKAALADLGKEYSIYGSALNVAAGATDQAIRRNEELNKTYASQINALQENARQLAAAGGERLLGPSIDRLVGGTNTLLSGFNESDGQNVGTVLGKGILDGIGQFIAGPGLALIGGVLLKLFRDLAKFATGSVQQLLGLNTAATQQRDLQTSIQQILSKNPKLIELALKGEQGLNAAANSLLASLQKQTVELQKQAQVAQQISKAFVSQAGVRMAGGVPVVPTKRTGKAAGYIPYFAVDDFAREELLAQTLGAKNPKAQMSKGTIDGKKFIKNNREIEITNFGKNGDSAVIPTYGTGFIPNFARTKLPENISLEEAIKRNIYSRSQLSQRFGAQAVNSKLGSAKATPKDNIFASRLIGTRLPTILTPGGGGRVASKTQKGVGPNGENIVWNFPVRGASRGPLKKSIESTFGSGNFIDQWIDKNLIGISRQIATAMGVSPANPDKFSQVKNAKGFKGAISGTLGTIFDTAVTTSLDIAAKKDGGDFDVRGGENVRKPIAKLFGENALSKGKSGQWLGDIKISSGSDAVDSMIAKTRKEWQNIFPPTAKKKTAYGGYIPNFAAIQDAINRERDAGIPKNQIYLAQEKALTSANPMGIGVFNKRDEPNKNSRKDAMRRKGFAKGYVPNFAIEDPDMQGTSAGTAATAIIAQLSGIAFAFAFTGNQFKDSLKELTAENIKAGRIQRDISGQRKKLFEEEVRLRGRVGAEDRVNERAKQAQFAPGLVGKGKAFLGANALGLSIAAPILGETLKNVAGQETPGARQFGEVASAAGQVGSFGATGALIAKGGGPIGLAIGALLTIPGVVNAFTTELPELTAAAKKASQDLTKFSDVSQRLLTASSSLSEFTDKGASPEKLKKVQDDLAKALSELTPAERSRIESSIRVGSLEEELAKITQERIDQEKLRAQAVSVRAIAEKKGALGLLPSSFDPNTAQGQLDEETIRSVFKGFFTGKTQEETLENFNKAAKSGVPQLENLIKSVAQLEQDINAGTAGNRNLYGTLEGPDFREVFKNILEQNIPQGKTLDEQEARSRFIKDIIEIADNDITAFQNIVQIPLKALTRDAKAFADGAKSAEIAAKNTAIFNKVKEKYSGIIENSISSLNRTISVFNSLANALDQFQVSAQSFEREQSVSQGFTLPKNVAETVLGPEAELTRRAVLFEKIAQNETARLDAIDKSNSGFREEFRGNLNEVFTERLKEIQTLGGADAKTIPEQSALAEEILKAQKLFESGAVNINDILEDSFKDGAIDSDKFETNLRAAFEKADFKSSETEKILDGILKVSEQQNANLLSINQNAKQQNVRAAQEFTNEKILLDISRSLKVFGGAQGFLQPQEGGIVKPLQTLIQSATGQLKAQRGFEFGKRAGVLTSFGTESQVQNNIGLGQSSLNFIKELKNISGGAFAPDPGSELYNRAVAGLTQSFQNNIKQLNDVLKDPNVDQAFKSQIKATLDAIGGLGSGREISQLQVAQETGAAFQSTLEGTLSRLQDPAIQDLRDAGLDNLANEVARSAQYTSDPIVNVLNVQKSLQTSIAKQLEDIKNLLPKTRPNTPTTSVSPPITDNVPTNAKGLIPAFNKERQAISRGVGGAKAGDRPQFIPNLNGSPAFVNSGEQLVNNFGGSGQTAVLTREMQNAMVAAKGFIPNFADGQAIITADSLGPISGEVIQDLADTGRDYIVIRSNKSLDSSFQNETINFGDSKGSGKIISIDPVDSRLARVKPIESRGILPPVRGFKFDGKFLDQPKKDLPTEDFDRKLDTYLKQYEEAARFTIPGNNQGTSADALIILSNLQREFQLNSRKYKDIDNNAEYKAIKESVKTLRDKIRSTNPAIQERPQDPEFLRFLEEEKNKPRGVGPTTAIQDQIAEAVAGSAAGDTVARATATNQEDLYSDAFIRAATVTAELGKYTGLNLGTNDAFGKAGERPKVKIKPQKGGGADSGEFVYGLSEFVDFYDKNPDIGAFFNEATHVNQNLVPGQDTLAELAAAEKAIQDNGGVNSYLQKLKRLADFIEQQNQTAQQKFVKITRVPSQASYDQRRFDTSPEGFVREGSEESVSSFDPNSGPQTRSTRYIQERASSLNDALSKGIVSGEINAKELGLLGIPLDVAKNIVAETIAIDKQLKEQKPYQPSRPVTPPPAVPGIPATEATVPPPNVETLPPKPKPKPEPVKPPAAIPGIQPAIQDTTPTITGADVSKYLKRLYGTENMGEAYERYQGMTDPSRYSREKFEKHIKEMALVDSERRATETPFRIIGGQGNRLATQIDGSGAGVPVPKGQRVNYPGGISPETARAIVQELDATYNEAIRKSKSPRQAQSWAQTQQRYRLLYSRGQYAELDAFYKSLSKDYQRPIGQSASGNQTNFAKGFIPNFAQDYISNLANLESGLSGKKARLTNIPGIGLAMINEDQSDGKFPSKDHPEGKMAAIRNSMKMQKSMGVMNKGFVPNFAATDQSFTQLESSFSASTSALTTLAGGIESLNSTLSNFEANFGNLNNVPGAQPAGAQGQAGGQPNVTTTTTAPVSVVVNAQGSNDIAAAVGEAVQNAIPTIIEKVKLALGEKIPPTN